MRTVRFLIAALIVVFSANLAQAHFPWIKVDSGGKNGEVKFYFEHAPKAGDGAYLDPFVDRAKVWLTTTDAQPQPIELEDTSEADLRWLEAELPAAAPRCVDLYTPWGVYRYGKTDVMLHYYARNIDAKEADAVAALAESKHLKLQLQPQLVGGELRVRVTWNGEPLSGQEIAFRSPTVGRNFKTDDDGVARLPVDRAGQYYLRTKLVEDTSGEFGGKPFAETHHHSTLVMRLAGTAASE